MSLATGSVSIPTSRDRSLSLIAVIVSAFISTLTFAITTPLLAVKLAAAGYSGGWIGLNTGAGAAARTGAMPMGAKATDAAGAPTTGGAAGGGGRSAAAPQSGTSAQSA